jgi:glutathione reductase (NADPH)
MCSFILFLYRTGSQPHENEAGPEHDFNLTVFLSPAQVGTIGLTESEAVREYGPDQVTVYETSFAAMYFALTTRKQVPVKCRTGQLGAAMFGEFGSGFGYHPYP